MNSCAQHLNLFEFPMAPHAKVFIQKPSECVSSQEGPVVSRENNQVVSEMHNVHIGNMEL